MWKRDCKAMKHACKQLQNVSKVSGTFKRLRMRFVFQFVINSYDAATQLLTRFPRLEHIEMRDNEGALEQD